MAFSNLEAIALSWAGPWVHVSGRGGFVVGAGESDCCGCLIHSWRVSFWLTDDTHNEAPSARASYKMGLLNTPHTNMLQHAVLPEQTYVYWRRRRRRQRWTSLRVTTLQTIKELWACHDIIGPPPPKLDPHTYNNAYKFSKTCITMYKNTATTLL